MAWRSPPLQAAESGRSQDPADRGPAEHYPFSLGQQLGEVLVVTARIQALGEGSDTFAQLRLQCVDRLASTVPVHQRRRPIAEECPS